MKLEELDNAQLITLIKELRSQKKYGLVWETEKTIEHFDEKSKNSFPAFHEVKSNMVKAKGDDITHILIEGDNYHALSLLNYSHVGKVDIICIDPPYNTGNKDFKYNDSFVEDDDTFKHSKWLSFMKKRLDLAHQLLNDDGIIFVNIGDNEQANLKLLMDDIFGEKNLVEVFIWESIFRPSNLGKIVRRNAEYILCYTKKKQQNFTLIQKSQETQGEASLTQNNNKPRQLNFPANYVKVGLKDGTYPAGEFGKLKMLSPLVVKNGLAIKPFSLVGKFKWKQEFLEEEISKGVVLKIKTKTFIPYYRKDYQETILRPTKLIPREIVGDVLEANAELMRIFGESVFNYPKPTSLIKYLISISEKKGNSLILDFFAGTGTTGDAVLQLNAEDGGARQFILVTNNEGNICTGVCFPRLKKVAAGYTNSSGKKISGLGGGIHYLKTKFISKTTNRDDLKLRISNDCYELLCLRENVFSELENLADEDYRIFQDHGKTVAIYIGIAMSKLVELKKKMNKLDGEKVLYCFTFDPFGLKQEEFVDWKDVRLEPIPQKIVELIEALNAN